MSELRHDADVHQEDGAAAAVAEAQRELEQWKRKVEAKDDAKSRLVLEKLEKEQEKKKSNNLMMELIKKQEGLQRELLQSSRTIQERMSEVRKRKMELTEKLQRSRAQLQQKKTETHRLDNKFKIWAELPDAEVEFVKPKQDDGDVTGEEPIRGQFCVCQEGALQLTGGQALITFEEEKVVSQLLQSGRCSVTFDHHTLEVTPKRIRTEPLVQFEIQLVLSRLLLSVEDLDSSMPKQRLEERLELAFCRPSRGGAEVQSVEVNPRQRSARVAFTKPGVAECFALRGEHTVDLDLQTVVKLSPVHEHQLHKFQSFCGAPKRSLLLDGIRDTGDAEEVQDQLEIHFQKPSNGGGEIEHTLYRSGRVWAVLSPEN